MLKRIIALLATLVTTVCLATALDINQASEAELDSIKGIGPGTSSKILDQRKKAKFKDWADLIARVKGIGDKKAQQFSEQGLTVQGAAFKPVGTVQKSPAGKAP
ncbi:MAG: helix-hairpin-helix domain-containing protein [Rhodoferax sp.]|nr:helix-hairpin-helix domain-containing protein [Rhodoferax sp.]